MDNQAADTNERIAMLHQCLSTLRLARIEKQLQDITAEMREVQTQEEKETLIRLFQSLSEEKQLITNPTP